MTHRLALAATLGLLAACGESAPATNPGSAGSSGSAAGGSSSGAASQAGTSSGGQSAGAAGQAAGTGGQIAGAGGSGGAAQAGTGGAAAGAPSLTLPVMRGELDVLELGALSFAVNPSKGARVVSFKLDGDELLTNATAHPQYFGSTLWTSPASDWVVPGTFVPPPVVDSEPYTTSVSADGVITATSATSTANGKQFVVTKIFRADLAKSAIVIEYQLKNTGAAPFRLSHWEVTRVFPNGLTFFPSGTTTKLDFLKQPVQVTQAQGYTWYDNETHVMGQGESKAGTDSPGGFIAHVSAHAQGDLLFIKAFKGATLASAPPDHYPVELYSNDPHSYVELEDHSAYDEIAAGATYTQTVTWYLRRLPPGTDSSAGSAALIAAALATLGK
jgi:hypothetical protein